MPTGTAPLQCSWQYWPFGAPPGRRTPQAINFEYPPPGASTPGGRYAPSFPQGTLRSPSFFFFFTANILDTTPENTPPHAVLWPARAGAPPIDGRGRATPRWS